MRNPFGRKPEPQPLPTPDPISVGVVMLEEHAFIVTAIATYAAMASAEHPEAPDAPAAEPIVFLDVEGIFQHNPPGGPRTMRLLLPLGGVEALRESLANCIRALENVRRSQEGE